MGQLAWESPHAALLAVAEQLWLEGVPLADLFSELIVASSDRADGAALTPAVEELLGEPMTAAESVGSLLLATTAARARDAGLDDEALLRVMAQAALLVARFETYVVARSGYPAP